MGLFSKIFKNQIVISAEKINDPEANNYEIDTDKEEEIICHYFIDHLSDIKDKSKFKIEHRSKDYTTLFYGNNDFMRVKYSALAKWISFSLSEYDRHKYENDPLFDLTQKKSSIHWRASINSHDDLFKFLQIAEHACYEQKVAGSDPPTEAEKVICDYIKELLLSLGAHENYITYHHYDSYAKINYCGRDIFKFKILKSKANYAILEQAIAKKAKLKLDTKNHLSFTSVDDLKKTPEIITYAKLQFERFKSFEKYYDNEFN